MPSKPGVSEARLPPPVAVRLPLELRRSLQEEADLEGAKLSVVIRRVLNSHAKGEGSAVVAALAEDLATLAQQLCEVAVALEKLRAQQALGFQTLLGNVGVAPEKAEAWARDRFSPLFTSEG